MTKDLGTDNFPSVHFVSKSTAPDNPRIFSNGMRPVRNRKNRLRLLQEKYRLTVNCKDTLSGRQPTVWYTRFR